MDVKNLAKKMAHHGVKRKLLRAIPLAGVAFSAFYVWRNIQTKGAARGGVDSALDMTPVVGRIKALYEMFRGDIIPAQPDVQT